MPGPGAVAGPARRGTSRSPSAMPRIQGRGFGASERFSVGPGWESDGLFQMPGGQSGHFLSPLPPRTRGTGLRGVRNHSWRASQNRLVLSPAVVRTRFEGRMEAAQSKSGAAHEVVAPRAAQLALRCAIRGRTADTSAMLSGDRGRLGHFGFSRGFRRRRLVLHGRNRVRRRWWWELDSNQ